MKKLIPLALILATVCWVKDDAPALPSAAKPKGVLVDRAAVALFDRSSKFYGECKTIRLRWTTRDESPSPDNAQKPTVTTIVFVRPSLSKVEIKNGLVPRAVSLVDGKFFWALANVSSALTTYSKEHLNKDETPLENSLLNLVFGTNNPGMIFYYWLGGRHELQSEQIKLMQEPHFNMMYFVATKLAPSNWKGRSWERVQIRERLCPQEDAEIADYDVNEDAVFNRIYWLAPDNARLVKMEELDAQGKVVFIHEIVEQTFNIAIPASTFVFKIPKGARKEQNERIIIHQIKRKVLNEVLIVGSVALDSVETPTGKIENALGGAATYGSVAASLFSPVNLVGVVGADFPEEHLEFLKNRKIDLAGLQIVEGGSTFRWKGDYNEDLNQAVTHETHLGVFEHFEPKLPDHYRDAEFVFLANINPELQLKVLEQVRAPRLVLCDTMNLWINIAREHVIEIFKRVDIAVLNDGEAKMLTELDNVVEAGRALQKLGPKHVVIKKGEHGALMFSDDEIFSAPSFPLQKVVDPTGAGDSFAGSLIGYLAQSGDLSRENLRRAIVTGSVVASTTVQDFSLAALKSLTREEVERRYEVVRAMSTF